MTKYMLNILVYHFLLVVSDHGASAQEHNLRTRREQELDSFTSIDGSSIDNGRDPEVFSANIDAALLDKEGPLTKSQTCQTYSMSFYNSNYNTPEIEAIVPYAGTSPYRAQQWGRHALQWKGYTYESQSFLNFYDAALAGALNWAGFYAFPSTPFFTVGANDAADLNDLEKVLPLHYGSTAEVNGVPVPQGLYRTRNYPWEQPTISEDPPGTWMSDVATGPVNGAILAAIYMHLWNTPVYANAYNAYPNSVTKVGQFVFEKVRLCVSGIQAPHIACGWNDYNSAINQNSGGSGYNCANSIANLSLNSVTFRFFPWELPFATVFNQWLTPSITIPGGNWATSGFWGCAGGLNCPIVFDPPVKDGETKIDKDGLDKLKKRAGAMEKRTYVPVFSKSLELKEHKLANEIVIPVGKEKQIHPRYTNIEEGPDAFKNNKGKRGEQGTDWEKPNPASTP